jgi:anti-sigma regulatory factor (Ser/Thr protein kinase)/serine/threonine protein phosphatase PrpC
LLLTAPPALAIVHSTDVAEASRSAKEFALQVGLSDRESEDIGLVATELASNLLRHAGGGTIRVIGIESEKSSGLEIEAADHGPGMIDVEAALTDGFSTAGSLGYGLGVVNRLMDELEIDSHRGVGTRVVCRRWVRLPSVGERACPLTFGAASRPRPGTDVNGDSFVICRWGEGALVGVIDGLGHGQFAHRAAQTARAYVQAHHDRPLAEIFRGTGRACRATRGVVMALARFDFSSETLSFASVGDVEVRVFGNQEPMNFRIRRGVLGLSAPAAEVTTHHWRAESVLILHSDGVRTRWGWGDFPQLANESATLTAQALLRALARDNDDATVVVVRDRVE